MEVLIEIKRQENSESKPYFQSIRLNLEKENLTVASLLMRSLCHAYKWKAKACLRCIFKGLC